MPYAIKAVIAFLFVFILGATFSTGVGQKRPIHVAVSVYNTGPAFMRKWVDDLNRHPAVLDGRVKLHVFNCTGSFLSAWIYWEACFGI